MFTWSGDSWTFSDFWLGAQHYGLFISKHTLTPLKPMASQGMPGTFSPCCFDLVKEKLHCPRILECVNYMTGLLHLPMSQTKSSPIPLLRTCSGCSASDAVDHQSMSTVSILQFALSVQTQTITQLQSLKGIIYMMKWRHQAFQDDHKKNVLNEK